MAESNSNYPDVLGHISPQAERLDLGLVQVMASCLPSRVPAGKPFRALLLIQNMSDAPVEMVVTLIPPAADSVGKRGRFHAKMQRIGVGMQPGEVGLVILPITSLPDAAPGLVRPTLGIGALKALERAERVRTLENSAPLYLPGLAPETRRLLENLGKLRYVGGKKAVLGGGAELHPAVMIEPGTLGTVSELQPEYRTLWTLADLQEDPLVLLERFKDDLTTHVLPNLDRTQMIGPLTDKTRTRFEQAGYPLQDVEAQLIGRAMANVLEYACTGQMSYGRTYLPQPDYEVAPLIQRPPADRPPIRRHWLKAVLNAIAEDNRVPRYITRAMVSDRLYDALLHDTLLWGLTMVEAATGIELGSTEELEAYAVQWMEKYHRCIQSKGAQALGFADVYLPLVLTGLVVYDEMLLPEEDVRTFNPLFQVMLRDRQAERNEENEPVFAMAISQLDKALKKYGLSLL
jgi:hypothetical protein